MNGYINILNTIKKWLQCTLSIITCSPAYTGIDVAL